MSRASVFRKLEALYREMQEAYDEVAGKLGHTCDGCARNCCVSHFEHHTYVEWAYFWKGMKALPEAERAKIVHTAEENVRQARVVLAEGMTPSLMCPVNVDGRCSLYANRLMICRLHGIPNVLADPRGNRRAFPGCWLSQELSEKFGTEGRDVPHLDRTPFYIRLAALEREFLGAKWGRLPKVDSTLSELIVAGEPRF
ncbi:hypothetical protein dsx2_3301 [Desulfovibrio sp. X2]|uniref:hypothetical protein n=1 Tax=Desulfovibrio sp. X2 TaxID=941449 RepID=UPI000358AAAD|nr:hypothetical protein [Desulfovibrio sp. X2]EPR40861.1 hypothetical protein dsx2_3301 [Desulfovibrio sp. X2]